MQSLFLCLKKFKKIQPPDCSLAAVIIIAIIFPCASHFASELPLAVAEWHEYECQQGVPAENLHYARHSVFFAEHQQNGQIPSVPAVAPARLLYCVSGMASV